MRAADDHRGDEGFGAGSRRQRAKRHTAFGARAYTAARLGAQVAAQMEGAPAAEEQEIVFAGEHCENGRALKHYGVCENFIVQVAGFYLNPRDKGEKYVDGVLVPLSTPEPDWDVYPA